ncbi:MAG: hypothetical protein M1840_005096 [Geoglossum simile]|nr:MAG: hypothetical protein M1840_005096 [Geoglossum simile]
MPSEQEPMTRGWFGTGCYNRLWGGWATYQFVPPNSLPPVPKSEGPDGFAWLRTAPEPEAALGPMGARDFESRLDAMTAEANQLGLEVPPALRAFVLDPSLHGKVPTSTCCYLSLSAKLIPLPDEKTPGRLLRFLNDQQCCLLWYLHLLPNGEHKVVCASPEWKKGDVHGATLDDRIKKLHGLVVCADGLEEFVRRFWVENWIWFDEHKGRELTGEPKDYVDDLITRFSRVELSSCA